MAFEPGLFVEVYPVSTIRLRGEVRQGVYGHHGTVGTVGRRIIFCPPGAGSSPLGRASMSGTRVSRGLTSGSARRGASTGRVVPYSPGSFYSAGLLGAVTFRQDDTWSYTGYAGYNRILGSSGESPLVDRPYGNPNQFTLWVCGSITRSRRRRCCRILCPAAAGRRR